MFEIGYGDDGVIALTGRFDAAQCEKAQKFLDAAGGPRVLDLRGLEYISSAGLRCLMVTARQAGEQRGRILVSAMQPIVAEIVRISRFNLVFEVFATTREALASVSPQAAQAFDRG